MAVKTKLPTDLSEIWDDEAHEAWGSLRPKHQEFFVHWVNLNFNATKAYLAAYNKLASNDVARATGAQLLANPCIQILCAKLSQTRHSDLLSIKRVYHDGMEAFKPVFNPEGDSALDVEDHPTRIKAADSLARLNGELVERSLNLNLNVSRVELPQDTQDPDA
jgi:hypothetical protein